MVHGKRKNWICGMLRKNSENTGKLPFDFLTSNQYNRNCTRFSGYFFRIWGRMNEKM